MNNLDLLTRTKQFAYDCIRVAEGLKKKGSLAP
jgi:hypothetical protein